MIKNGVSTECKECMAMYGSDGAVREVCAGDGDQ